MSYILVFFGGGLGATLRHLINLFCARCIGTGFPWGTFIINITGSTVMGLIAGYLAFKGEAAQPWRLFLMTGILGGYTTSPPFRSIPRCSTSAANLARGALRARLGGAVDRRPFCRPRAGPPSDLSRRVTAPHGYP